MSTTNTDVPVPHLLALTIRTMLIFAVAIFFALLLLGQRQDEDFSKVSEQEHGRYTNARLLEALKTFEYGVVALENGKTPVSEITREALLEAVPQCVPVWDDAPDAFSQWRAGLWARLRNKEPPLVTTTAERMAKSLSALTVWLSRQSTDGTGAGNYRFAHRLAFDLKRWSEAVSYTLESTVPRSLPDGRTVQLKLTCVDMALAVQQLVKPDTCLEGLRTSGNAACPILETLAWRQTTPVATVRKLFRDGKQQDDPCKKEPWICQQLAIPDNLIAQRNPWQGIPGCVFWRGTAQDGKQPLFYASNPRNSNHDVCENKDVAGVESKKEVKLVALAGRVSNDTPLDDPRWGEPPSLGLILRPLDALRYPGSELYKKYTRSENPNLMPPEEAYRYGPNQVEIGDTTLDVGFSVDLTLNPVAQSYAQQVAACYTGAQEVCRKLGIERAEDKGKKIGSTLLEDAMTRMTAVVIVDIPSGKIEAIAGAFSPCARQDEDGPGRGKECDNRLPWKPAWRPDRLENPALFYDAMPASTVKPIMASAFFGDGPSGQALQQKELASFKTAPPAAGLRRELMRSNSVSFLDRMFCDMNGRENCKRPWLVQDAASRFGWNAACAEEGGKFCGSRDVLFGRAPDEVGNGWQVEPLRVMYGRLMTQPVGSKEDWRFRPMPDFSLDWKRLRECQKNRWKKCAAGPSGGLVHEGFGQGDARVSVLGVAGMMALMGSAANGAKDMPAPYLVENIRGVGKADDVGVTLMAAMKLPEPFPVPVSQQVAQIILSGLNWSHRGDGTASSACKQLWGQATCAQMAWIAGKTGTPSFAADEYPLTTIEKECAGKRKPAYCSSMRPYKWYTGVFRHKGSDKWDKAIAVLTERNWVKATGRVHGSGEHGPNPSAEIGLLIARCLHDNPGGQNGGACRPVTVR